MYSLTINRHCFLILLALAMGSFPAFAGKDFIKGDYRDRETRFVQLLAQDVSSDKLTFVVHGGKKSLMMVAYRVAQRLDDEGVPVAFLLAPDKDNNETTTWVDFYTKGGTKYYSMGFSDDLKDFEDGMYRQALKAYREDFPKLAEKTHP